MKKLKCLIRGTVSISVFIFLFFGILMNFIFPGSLGMYNQIIIFYIVVAMLYIFYTTKDVESLIWDKLKIQYRKWFVVTILIIFVLIPIIVQFCPQIVKIIHFDTSDSPTWIGYWGNILGSALGIVGAFMVSAKYADNRDKKEGPRGPEEPQGPRGPEGPSGSPSDYSGIIEAINQLNTNIENNRNYNYGYYRNELALHRYIRRLIDLKRELNDINDFQKDVKKEYVLRKLQHFFSGIRYDYYNVEPIKDIINNLMDDNRNAYSINEINTIIDDLIYELINL